MQTHCLTILFANRDDAGRREDGRSASPSEQLHASRSRGPSARDALHWRPTSAHGQGWRRVYRPLAMPAIGIHDDKGRPGEAAVSSMHAMEIAFIQLQRRRRACTTSSCDDVDSLCARARREGKIKRSPRLARTSYRGSIARHWSWGERSPIASLFMLYLRPRNLGAPTIDRHAGSRGAYACVTEAREWSRSQSWHSIELDPSCD